jgi:hypothetical protein
MALTAQNTIPAQMQQMGGAPTQLQQMPPQMMPQKPSADILLHKKTMKKKKTEEMHVPIGKPSADILTRRKK